jgi:K+-transporting ATPase ATPase A chain
VTPLDACAIVLPLGLVLLLAIPLGGYVARVWAGEDVLLTPILGPLERTLYRVAGVEPSTEQSWSTYAASVLVFNAVGFVVVLGLQLAQGALPLNPQGFGAPPWHVALDTAISFVTNTNWQSYAGESSLSYFTQAVGLTVQNFASAATGMAIVPALARGFTRKESPTIGCFTVDLVRALVYVLLPLSFALALVLVSQGVVQTAAPYTTAHPLEGGEQLVAVGPVASQEAIKMLGTNGGGFFNANSAHPFENPTPLTDLVELVAILVVSAALCETFGRLVADPRQGRALLATMTAMLVPMLVIACLAEAGNWEGKEVRFGPIASAEWAVFTTAASNGSVNAMHDSFTAVGGLVPLWLILLGEVVFGGVGSGLYGLVAFALVAVFVAGLMVGRTPEYLGKKIQAFEMQMASIAILAPAFAVLIGTAAAVVTGQPGVANPGPHGFTEILYAFASASNNNGSAFAGLGAATAFYDVALGVAMLVGRYPVMLAILAIAGSLAAKKPVPAGSGTLPTHEPLFVGLLIGTVALVGALTFLPALALGPIAEALGGGRP